ncbi:hypothetical protein SRO_0374 [Streptomyces rochei]|nr:hypothetical protein SRO_0374 [Streptomyces rochei]
MCTRYGAKSTNERWQQIRQHSWPGGWDRPCGPCAQEVADRAEALVARRQAEDTERAPAEASTVEFCIWFGSGPGIRL